MWRNARGASVGGTTASRVVALAGLPATVRVDERVEASVFLTRRRPPSIVLNAAILGTTREEATRAWIAAVVAAGVLGVHVRVADTGRGRSVDPSPSRQ